MTITKPKVSSDFQRIRRLNKLLGEIIDKRLNIVSECIMLGYPFFTSSKACPTSMIEVTKDGRIRYVWNRDFYDECSDLAIKYIALHECLHVLLNHIPRREKRNPGVWNIAADCVINEMLDDIFVSENLVLMIDSIDKDESLADRCNLDRLKQTLKIAVPDKPSTEQLYDVLYAEAQKQAAAALASGQPSPDSGSGSGGDGDDDDKDSKDGKGKGKGKGKKKQKDLLDPSGYGTLDKHDSWDENHTPIDSHTQAEVHEAMKDLKQACKEHKIKTYGSGSDHMTVEIEVCTEPPRIPWQRLLRNRMASIRKPNDAENWARPHRKLYDQYPDVILPGPHENESLTSSIAVFIDTSMSMDDSAIAELVAIVGTLPEEEFEINRYWFDTEVYIADDLLRPQGRGGTSFSALERVATQQKEVWKGDDSAGVNSYRYSSNRKKAEKQLERYPDVLIVLTDGYADTPVLQHPQRWIWLITKDGSDSAVSNCGSTIWHI